MNIGYLIVPVIVGLAVGVSAFFVQKMDITGSVASVSDKIPTGDAEKNITQENASKCTVSCDDSNSCTVDWCNETSNYFCSHMPINGTSDGCWGNPTECTVNTCISGACSTRIVANCCGNDMCESSENCNTCTSDCGGCPLPVVTSTATIQTISSPTDATSIQPANEQSQPNPPAGQANQVQEQTVASNQTNTTNQTNNTENQTGTLDHVIINEFTTRGPNGTYDEFVELYNPTNSDVDMSGWKLQYKSATGDSWQSKVGSGMTGMIKFGRFFLLASKSYSLGVTPDYLHTANWGLADSGGHLRIIDSNGSVIDKVGWGNANEPEGSAAPALEENKSLDRVSLTADTDNNANDFILVSPSPNNGG